jgi:hypothetical protein
MQQISTLVAVHLQSACLQEEVLIVATITKKKGLTLFSVMHICVSLLSPGFLCPGGRKRELQVDIRPNTSKVTEKSSITITSLEQTLQIRKKQC